MSIYAVKICDYFTEDNIPKEDLDIELEMIKSELPKLKCNICGKEITMQEGYISHAFCYGYDDTNYCSDKCFKIKDRRPKEKDEGKGHYEKDR